MKNNIKTFCIFKRCPVFSAVAKSGLCFGRSNVKYYLLGDGGTR